MKRKMGSKIKHLNLSTDRRRDEKEEDRSGFFYDEGEGGAGYFHHQL
jgi:hypothetical protein